MSSIVIELQQEALDPDITITTLLRKALIVAKKLDIVDFEKWILKELNGYEDKSDLPAYRWVRGEVKVFHRFHGYYPAICPDEEIQEKLTNQPVFIDIGQVEHLSKGEDESHWVEIGLPGNLGMKIMQGVGGSQPAKVHVSLTQFKKIMDAVRNIVLNWCLRLEKDGILGDGHSLTFSKEEKRAAAQTTYSVNNFYGNTSQLQIQQGTNQSTQEGKFSSDISKELERFINDMKKILKPLKLDNSDHEEVKAELVTLEAQVSSSRPKINVIGQSLKTIRTVLEGAAGNVLASGLIQKIPELLQMLGIS